MLENKKNLGIQIISNLQIQTNYITKCKKNLHIISEPLAVSLRNHKEWERCQKPWEMFYFAISWKLKIHKLDVILKEGEPCWTLWWSEHTCFANEGCREIRIFQQRMNTVMSKLKAMLNKGRLSIMCSTEIRWPRRVSMIWNVCLKSRRIILCCLQNQN